MASYEINFDCLVGPTHNYSGLSYDNIAATLHKGEKSNPKQAALQGLKKMKLVAGLGVKQAVLPPHPRPALSILKRLGFEGIKEAYKEEPLLLSAVSSSAFMWSANSATFTPSSDSTDGKAHITPANLVTELHRSIESAQMGHILKAIFNHEDYFMHHEVLPNSIQLSDEGAANHTRFCPSFDKKGIHFFTFGRYGYNVSSGAKTSKFLPRQTIEASKAIGRLHKLDPENVIYAQQNPDVIDEGIFHNDVIAVGNQNFFFYHQLAYINTEEVITSLKKLYEKVFDKELITLCVNEKEISVSDAVNSYIFNSQIVTVEDEKMVMIVPSRAKNFLRVKKYLDSIISLETPIKEVIYTDIDQSMNNGGGPACLRLRVVLNEKEINSLPPQIFLTDSLYDSLYEWINKNYRDSLTLKDLKDPDLHEESIKALDELASILGLSTLYKVKI